MCCSPAATKGGAARAVPVVLGETAPKDAVAAVPSASRHFGRPLSPSAARPLAVRRPAPAPRHAQTRVSREDLDRVRIALEQELAAGAPLSDEEIVERVSSSRLHLHPLIVSIVLSKLREQNPAFFASYDAKKRENSMTMTATATIATPSVSTSTAMLTSSSGDDDASLRATNSSSSEEEEEEDDDEGACNDDNDNDRRDGGSSSEDDAVVPLFS